MRKIHCTAVEYEQTAMQYHRTTVEYNRTAMQYEGLTAYKRRIQQLLSEYFRCLKIFANYLTFAF